MEERRLAPVLVEFGRLLLLSTAIAGTLAGVIPGLFAFSAADLLQAAAVWLPAVLAPLFLAISFAQASKSQARDLFIPGLAAAFGLASIWHFLSMLSSGFVIG